MSNQDQALIAGIRAAVQLMATHMQMKMGLEEQQQFKDLARAQYDAILVLDVFGGEEQRKHTAHVFRSIMAFDDDVEESQSPNLTVIDGGKDDT